MRNKNQYPVVVLVENKRGELRRYMWRLDTSDLTLLKAKIKNTLNRNYRYNVNDAKGDPFWKEDSFNCFSFMYVIRYAWSDDDDAALKKEQKEIEKRVKRYQETGEYPF